MPALACVIPIVSVNAAYLISLTAGQVDACFPYLDGCTSISRAARQEPAIHLFRATMIPVALIMAAVWWLAAQWLARYGESSAAARRTVIMLGTAGAGFLVLYATFLGTHGVVYEALRRYGVIVFFAFTALAQLICTARLQKLRRQGRPVAASPTERAMLLLTVFMLALGLANIPASNFLDNSALENAIEWNFALLMMGWFGLLAREWKRVRLAVRVISSRTTHTGADADR